MFLTFCYQDIATIMLLKMSPGNLGAKQNFPYNLLIKVRLLHVPELSKGRYYRLPSVPCALIWVIVASLCDENMNFTQSFGGIFASLRMRYGGKVGSE